LAGLFFTGYRNQFVDPETRASSAHPELLAPRFEKDANGVWKSNILPACKPLLVALGTFILYFGWFGFNGGSIITILSTGIKPGASLSAPLSIISKGSAFGRILIVMSMSASVASLTTLLLGRWENRAEVYYKWSMNDVLNGTLSGLVCITPGAGYVDVWAAVVFGILSAFAYKATSMLLSSTRVRFDDPVDAVAVHCANGVAKFVCIVLLKSLIARYCRPWACS
jgi:Amt family ammonium transporter